jgi:magnesium chelatase family protein
MVWRPDQALLVFASDDQPLPRYAQDQRAVAGSHRHAKGDLEVSRIDYEKLSDARWGEATSAIRTRARRVAARDRQARRFAGTPLACNADMGVGDVRVYCILDDAGRSLMKSAMAQLQMSARAFHRVLKLSHTIADLAGSEAIKVTHLAEALQYRPRRQDG